MKKIATAILSAALFCVATTSNAGETRSMPAASAAAVPAAAKGDAAIWLLLAEISVSDGEVSGLQSCLDQDRVATMVNSFARKLEAAAMPVEPSSPWLSCGEAGCP